MNWEQWDVSKQGTSGWLKARMGYLTASRMSDAIQKNGKESEIRRKLKIDLLAERLSNCMVEHYVSPAMQWGIEQEPVARERYEEITGRIVQECGFCRHFTIDMFGASPDGLFGDDGLVEIKCPTTQTHITWLLDGVVPEKHRPQLIAQLCVTRRQWVDFVSFDPRCGPAKEIFILRYEPTIEEKSLIETAAVNFLAEVEAMWEILIKV